jgi:NAD(P)-dependent dehydrogenase (short-subunit alcohol dehydrogenase family)
MSVDFSLDGKVAIVTGAAGGIGRDYSRGLAEAGAAVVVADVNGDGANEVANTLEQDGLRALGVQVDVGNEESVAAMVERTKAAFGGVDILVNNAAATDPEHALTVLLDVPFHIFDETLRTNLTGQLICARACVPSMIERGGGKIINQSSVFAFLELQPYGISKLGIVGLTAGLARELGQHNINVNAIAPGWIQTASAEAAMTQEWKDQILAAIAIKRGGQPADLLGTLIFFASPASDWITGQTLCVDGGWVMRT